MHSRSLRIMAILLLTLNSISAFIGGAVLMHDPTGIESGLKLELLTHSPFHNFFLPGLVLFVVNGMFGVWVILKVMSKAPKYPLLLSIQGILLGGWIIVQIVLIRNVNFLHFAFLSIAITFFILGFLLRKAGNKNNKFI